MIIKWHKCNENAKIPTKRNEDAGFDIYTIENDILLPPFSKRLFSTGLNAAPEPGYWLMGFDRGSTGSKGLHVHCGVVDNGYRGEIFICISNDNDYPVLFTDLVSKPSMISTADEMFDDEIEIKYSQIFCYPTTKAIAQLIPVKQPDVESYEVSDEEWEELANNSERGAGKLGASGK